jgi:hypothetical protein
MTPVSKNGYRWLDSLARRAAGGQRQEAGVAAVPGGEVSALAGGSTRRTALRAAAGTAGAVVLFGSFRFLRPPPAGAATTKLAECTSNSFKAVYDDFQACVKNPLAEFEETGELIAEKEDFLRHQKKPAARRRLKKLINELGRRRGRALKDLEFCNAVFVQDRAKGEDQCEETNQPPGGTGGSGTGGNTGCEPGYLLCGENCCGVAYAFCQGCGSGPICCRIDGNCCPGG